MRKQAGIPCLMARWVLVQMAERVTLHFVIVADDGTGETLKGVDDWERVLAVLRAAYESHKVLVDRVIDVVPNY